ncbi:hypothetical protein BKA93DRAFT_731484 [Sparassis latifolia]
MTAADFSRVSTRTPSSPSHPVLSRGLGDLRNVSRKPWSKSADDLGKFTSQLSTPPLTPIDTSFQGRIKQYRNNRSDSFGSMNTIPSPAGPPAASSQKHFPFPVIAASESLSSSPPSRSAMPPPAPSPGGSSSGSLTPIGPNTGSHVHVRSHSFTPRLPSKLSAPKMALVPPSPKRKGSSSSDRESDRERDKTTSGGAAISSPSRSPFPFSLSGGGNAYKATSPFNPTNADSFGHPPSSSKSLAPPTIVEPENDGLDPKRKRTSQVVYHSGFVNRLVDFSPSGMNARANHAYMAGGVTPSFSKGWKPFKLVLKGSKLYFYKPPSDRSAAVKELFPTELVAVLEDETLTDTEAESNDVDVEDQERGGKGKEREETRRRRAYWGRSTHPSLVVGATIERGTFEALIHEAVFATTFANPSQQASQSSAEHRETEPDADWEDAVEKPQNTSRYRPEWRNYSSAALLCLPALVDRQAFETEFMRCCAYLVSGTNDDAKVEECARVRWLATTYLKYYGKPLDADAWEKWRADTISDSEVDDGPRISGLPQSSSMQGLYALSPRMFTSPQTKGQEFSPNVGMFSPRPEGDSRLMSLVDALAEPPQSATSHSVTTTHPTTQLTKTLWNILERDGLSRDVLIGLDPRLVSRSLLLYQKRLLRNIPDNFTADLCLGPEEIDVQGTVTSDPTPSLAPFYGSEELPHWLTRLILIQILVPESHASSTSYGGTVSHVPDMPTSRTHSRSELVSAWARIGEACRRSGNECSWRAIMAALCSRPVARLEKVWKRVDVEAFSLVQSWVRPCETGETMHVEEPKVVPWAGDVRRLLKECLERSRTADCSEWQVDPLIEARERFEAFRTEFSLCGGGNAEPGPVEDTDDVEALVEQWKNSCDTEAVRSVASKFIRIDQFMSLSLAAEPRRKGLFEPYYWTRPAAQQLNHSLAALLFPEPLPTSSLINRELASRGRLESNASTLNVQDLEYLREVRLKSCNDSVEPAKPNSLDLGGTILPVFNGELLLLVQPGADTVPCSRPGSRTASRPPSSVVDHAPPEKTIGRTPSMRVTPGSSHVLERKPSVIRRNSLPSMSQRTSLVVSEVSSERPLRVVVQAGTLDRLVDVLAHGLQGISVSVADDNGEMPLNDKKVREVKVDMDDFFQVWWNVFRSFVTPQVLFELLRKQYIGAHLGATPSAAEVSRVVKIRSEILETMNEWINRGGGAQDALDDVHLFNSFDSFFRHSPDHALPSSTNVPNFPQALNFLDQIRKNVQLSFTSQTMRPLASILPISESSMNGLGIRSFSSEPPEIDQIDPEELVNNLDAMVSAAFRNVSEEDLFVTADLLEIQSADRTGWFLPRDPSSIADEVEIQFMDAYIMEIEPSSLISEMSQDCLYRLLPPSIRSCIRAFGILRKWLLSKLITPKLGLRARHARMELIMQAIEVCRLRSESGPSHLPLPDRPCTRTFVEAILTSAVLSVESRMYQRAWQIVASARGTSCDTLYALLNKPAITSITSRGSLVVDVGWVLDKMLEIISTPDILESTNQESVGLVNFDKRRSLHTLIKTTAGPIAKRRNRRHNVDRHDFERLNRIEKEMNSTHFDFRVIREEAHREATQAGPPGSSIPKRIQRPFHGLVSLQQEKNKRDRYLKDRLSREKRLEQQRNDKREEYLNKAMNTRRQFTSVQKQHRNKKSMSSAFFQLMRPISSAFSSESVSAMSKRTPAELDFTPAQKPSLVLSVVDARVSHFVNNERSFTFQLDTDDGGHCLLQAIGKPEMKKWMDTIQHVSKTAAKRRLTYLGQNSKMQLSDHLLSKPATASRDPVAVFGVELEFLLEREAPDCEVQPGAIPSVIERLICEVESRGLTEIGIYRVAGAHSEVNACRDALNRGEWPISESTDVHAVCDLVKSWFRVLPGGVFPSASYSEILSAAALDGVDLDTRLSHIRKVVHGLPDPNFDLLRRIVEHLEKVTDFEENNQMTAESLATVFSPNFLRSPNNDLGAFFANMSAAHRVTKLLIAHFHMIFDTDVDQDHEAELDHDQDEYDFEEPIPEEDEDMDIVPDPPEKDSIPLDPPVLDAELSNPLTFPFPVSS